MVSNIRDFMFEGWDVKRIGYDPLLKGVSTSRPATNGSVYTWALMCKFVLKWLFCNEPNPKIGECPDEQN